MLIIALPATIGIALLAGPILSTLLQYGKFTALDVSMASKSLLGFTIGVPAFMLVKILASGFYSRQDIKTPVRIAIIAMVSNIILDAILVFPLKHAGLALATSLTSSLNAGLLFWTIWRNKHYVPGKGWGVFWARLAFASVIMALLLFFMSSNLATWLTWNWHERAVHLGILCVAAVASYIGCLWLTGMHWREFLLHE